MTGSKEELDELRPAVRDFLAAKSPQSAVRAAMAAGQHDAALWDQMGRQFRLQGLALPAGYGGDGFGLTELGVVLEEMGDLTAREPGGAGAAAAAPPPVALGALS